MSARIRMMAAAIATAGAAIALVPQYTKCAAMMACWGAARAEAFVGGGIVAAAAVVILATSPLVRSLAAGVATLLSASAILMVLWQPGTCGNAMMRCNTLMTPTLLLLAGGAALLSMALMVSLAVRRAKPVE